MFLTEILLNRSFEKPESHTDIFIDILTHKHKNCMGVDRFKCGYYMKGSQVNFPYQRNIT